MSEEDLKSHLWIPDEEVVRIDNKPTARNRPRDVVPEIHGRKLSAALEAIVSYYKGKQDESSLADELMVFKITLPKGEKIDNSERQAFLKSHGININVVKDRETAIVTTTPQLFHRLRNKVEQYKTTGKYANFQYIDNFEPFTADDKQSASIRHIYIRGIKPPVNLDLQLLLVPNLRHDQYNKALPKLKEMITKNNGRVISQYYLSDATPVIRAMVPSASLERISSDDAVYRVEETRFFSAADDKNAELREYLCELNPNIDIDSLPIVVILDTGVNFPPFLDPLIAMRWMPEGVKPTGDFHGTEVASRAIFGSELGEQIQTGILTPRVRIIDATIMDGEVPEDVLIKRLQDAVRELSPFSKIFNLSVNVTTPIEGDEMSIIGYELDNLMRSYSVQFVLSVGNHHLWKTESDLGEIIDDDDSCIAAPADSILGIAVGAVVATNHIQSMSKVNEIAPYSRRGPGFAGYQKPDIVAYSGTVYLTNTGLIEVPFDLQSLVILPTGQVKADAGTSFAAPVVAGDLAVIASKLPRNDILLAKALLYHGAEPLWDEDALQPEEKELIAMLYGRGLSQTTRSLYSAPSRVVFVRTGELNRLTKERVKFWMPSILAAQPGRNTARVAVTCVTRPPLDRTKGQEYLGAFISASLHKVDTKNNLPSVNPKGREGRRDWDVCHHFCRSFSRFQAGDWQVWLELRTRWDVPDDEKIPYALVLSIEDLSGIIDIYSEVLNETQGRFMPITTVQVPAVI